MNVLKSVFKISLAGLTFTYLASANIAAATDNSFKKFSMESSEETQISEEVSGAATSEKQIIASAVPTFLSETSVAGVYTDGCDTFETSSYEGQSDVSENVAFNSEAMVKVTKTSKTNGFDDFSDDNVTEVTIAASSSIDNSNNSEDNSSETFTLAQTTFGGSEAVSDKSLSETRGASLQVVGDTIGAAILTANAVGNNSSNSVTGANTVNGDAFGSASGVVSLIQNSGNNVIIQSATVVNLKLE